MRTRRNRDNRRGVFTSLALLAGMVLRAEPFVIQSHVIGGGGDTSGGGPFTLTATLSQPEAFSIPLAGESFVLQGGFWSSTITWIIPEGPTLQIEMLGTQIRIAWSPNTPGFVLHESKAPEDSIWVPVAGGTQSPVLLSVGEDERFFRLIHP